jgi:uncharacterized RDD family membrane protein YckC
LAWYYAEGVRQIGPFSDNEFRNLIAKGLVGPSSLVWRPGMASWLAYSQIGSERLDVSPENSALCAQCGRVFSRDDMIPFNESWICEACKSSFIQRIKEGLRLPGQLDYAGFWIRLGAKLIDWMIIWAAHMVVYVPLSLLMTPAGDWALLILTISTNLFQIVLFAVYNTYFIGRFGATIGKMAVGIRVVTADGDAVTYMRALGRYFAEILSGITLLIGYVMAGFDEEKRALHDRICSTRVIRR